MNSLRSVNNLPTQPRIVVKFSVCRLPEEIWFFVTTVLPGADLQQLALTCHRLRYFLLKYPPQPTLLFPGQGSSRFPLEIEMKMANKLAVNSGNMSRKWTKQVL
ncbi:hypothetical protein V8B55DRAFT_1431177 [Mucor lusitanicus]|uniref:F-box domain-containing protein n=1 Tax=Mucor lusitanicus CBS 277.49 TaxID=747725 RepID=A0A162QER0_MUCCL|nr:hypothetical protein MUCCIDRAFT_112855 [Mucor lusitanicus CBS 277.49]